MRTFCPARMPPRRRKYNEHPAPHGMAAASSKVALGFEGARTLLCQASVLGVRPGAEPEDLVPRFESAYLLSDRFDFSGKVRPEDGLPRFQEAEEEPNEKWIRLPQTDVPRGHGRRTDPDQDLIILRGRLFHFLGLEDGRRSVFRADNRFHWIPSSPPRHTAKFSSRLTDRRGS